MQRTLEYRHIANRTLSTRPIERVSDVSLSPLGTHPRSAELDRYFRLWLERLGVDDERYAQLAAL